MFEHNQSLSYDVAKLRHEQLVREIQEACREAQLACEATADQKAVAKFRLMYRVRRFMHRVVPALARVMF